MISFRQVVVVLLVIAGLWLFKRFKQHLQNSRQRHPQAQADFHETVRCIDCGVYIPRRDAISKQRLGYACADKKSCIQRNDRATEDRRRAN